jgi:hypothetical protein
MHNFNSAFNGDNLGKKKEEFIIDNVYLWHTTCRRTFIYEAKNLEVAEFVNQLIFKRNLELKCYLEIRLNKIIKKLE